MCPGPESQALRLISAVLQSPLAGRDKKVYKRRPTGLLLTTEQLPGPGLHTNTRQLAPCFPAETLKAHRGEDDSEMPDGESTLCLLVFPTQGCQAQTDTKTLLQSEEEAPRALSQGTLAQAPSAAVCFPRHTEEPCFLSLVSPKLSSRPSVPSPSLLCLLCLSHSYLRNLWHKRLVVPPQFAPHKWLHTYFI